MVSAFRVMFSHPSGQTQNITSNLGVSESQSWNFAQKSCDPKHHKNVKEI